MTKLGGINDVVCNSLDLWDSKIQKKAPNYDILNYRPF